TRLGSVSRIPASEIEGIIHSAIREHLDKQQAGSDAPNTLDRSALAALVSRIEVQRDRLIIALRPTDPSAEPETISVPWQKPPFKRFRKILLPHGTVREDIRPDRAERRIRLVKAIARGRAWLKDIISSSVIDAEQLAKRERCTVRQVNMTLSLAFLAPQLVKAAVEG